MLVANYTTVRPEMGQTRTLEDFGKFLGTKAHRMGVLARLYPENTITALTDLLGNIWMGDSKKKLNQFNNIDSTYFEWNVEVNQIKKIHFAEVPTQDGADGSEIEMTFDENYFQLEEIFKIDNSGQQCIVTTTPVRKADNMWSVCVRLIDNDYRSVLDTTACQIGMTCHWIGNAKPEMSDCGFVKYQSNFETMRNFMTLVRVDDTFSDKYKLMEDTLIKIAEGKTADTLSERVYKMDPMDKVLTDNFMMAREQMMLMSKTNMDVNGKATISTRNTGREIQIGEGLIPQIERYCNKLYASKFTINTFHQIMDAMVEKADNLEGNHFVFVCNSKLMGIVNRVLMKFLAEMKTDGALFYSKVNGGSRWKVGASFSSYEYNGNIISFKADKTLSREYNMPFGMCIDFTGGKTSAIPPIQCFSLKGKDYMPSSLDGPGYGVERVSTMVAGGAKTIMGYCGIAVFNPYKSFIVYAED